jgi:hypothetical protein
MLQVEFLEFVCRLAAVIELKKVDPKDELEELSGLAEDNRRQENLNGLKRQATRTLSYTP